MKEDSSFYYVIPAKVMHAEALDWSHKCLYAQIAGLAKKEGYCWASNSYLANLNKVSERQIQRILQKLIEEGFIKTDLDEKQQRRLYIGATCDMTDPSYVHDISVVPHIKDELVKLTDERSKGKITASEDKKDPIVPATDGYILAAALLKMIRRNKKHYSKIARFFSIEKEEESLRRWAKDIDLLLTSDAKAFDDVVKVLQWCQKDEFWQGQILSGNKLRKQYETLRLGSCGAVYGVPPANQNITDMLVKAYGYLCNNSKWQPSRGQVPKFLKATDRVIAFIDLHSDRGLTPEELIKHLRNCLQETFREKGEIVHPGHLNSEYTWDVLLPQYLENVIGAL